MASVEQPVNISTNAYKIDKKIHLDTFFDALSTTAEINLDLNILLDPHSQLMHRLEGFSALVKLYILTALMHMQCI